MKRINQLNFILSIFLILFCFNVVLFSLLRKKIGRSKSAMIVMISYFFLSPFLDYFITHYSAGAVIFIWIVIVFLLYIIVGKISSSEYRNKKEIDYSILFIVFVSFISDLFKFTGFLAEYKDITATVFLVLSIISWGYLLKVVYRSES